MANTPIARTMRVISRVMEFKFSESRSGESDGAHRRGLKMLAPLGPMTTPKRNAKHASPI